MLGAFITGVAGETLTPGEAAFLRSARPCGLILFTRNCRTHEQIAALVASARSAVGSDEMLVLIDQEGGRVQRLRPPLGRSLPPAAAFGAMARRDPARASRAAYLAARLLADELGRLGIDTNCAPVLDVPVRGAHDIIGDRAYGASPGEIVPLARAVAEGLLGGGMLPVMKHIPGHGRATQDSHLALPVVTEPRPLLSSTDFEPFRALRHLPAAMTAHVVFSAIDPDAPASTSAEVTTSVIRGEIGFQGLLMSDDLSMRALSGPMRERAEAVIRAGSDLALHCCGDLAEMERVAEGVPPLSGEALTRFRAARRAMAEGAPLDAGQVAEAEVALADVGATYTVAAESV